MAKSNSSSDMIGGARLQNLMKSRLSIAYFSKKKIFRTENGSDTLMLC